MKVILSTAYLGPVSYYSKLYAASEVVLEQHEHYKKQTYRTRCVIASSSGIQALTVPIVRDDPSHTAIRDIQISDYGNWQHLHWQAFITAYDNSPYFEYYADDLREVYERRFKYLWDFNEALRETLCRKLDFQPRITLSEQYEEHPDAMDLRNAITPKQSSAAAPSNVESYHQVFERKFGFLPDLSIVDLLFNVGPESLLLLDRASRQTAVPPVL